jgi:hypothetical protein
MPRYNTSLPSKTITGTHTIATPDSGAFIQLAGTGGYTVTLPASAAFPGQEFTFHNTTSGTVTLSTPSGAFTGLGASGTATQALLPNTVTSVVSDSINYVTLSEDGSVLFATDATVTGNLTVNTAGTTAIISPGNLTINPGNPGSVNNVNIGASTRGSGSFTSLNANSSVTLTANTTSSGTSSGTLVVTGGVGVSGTVHAGAFNGPLTGTLQTAAQPNITSTGILTAPGLTSTLSGSASSGSINITASDPFIRFTDSDGATNNSKWDLRAIGASGSEAFEIRTINDANTVFNTRVSIKHGGQVVIGSSNSFSTSSVPLYVVGGTNGWSVFERNSKRLYINPNFSDLNTTAQVTSEASSNMALSLSARETIDDLYLATNGNVGIGTLTSLQNLTVARTTAGGIVGVEIRNTSGVATASSTSALYLSATGGVANAARISSIFTGTPSGNHAQDLVFYAVGAGSTPFEAVRINSSGHLIPGAQDSYDLGSASRVWRNIFTGDLHLSNESKSKGNSVDGTKGNWTIQEGEEDLYIINNKNGKKYKFKLEGLE